MEKEPAQGSSPVFGGEVLLCEDSETNQHFIKFHLNRLGLDVVTAGNGREGVETVSNRIKGGAKPFDLIFMDIQMPVMGGLEAADILADMGVKTPIVALTANVMPRDRAIYAEHGMPRSLSKPFTEEELHACLYEYFVPLGSTRLSEDERIAQDEKQRKKLYTGFVRRNQTTYADICAALEAGDVKLAHRYAHTLRGLAGLMGKTKLQEASRVVESSLAEGDAVRLEKEDLESLGHELKSVLSELASFAEDSNKDEDASPDWDKNAVRQLFDKLEPLLEGDSAESQGFADALRAVPHTGELVTLIEDYEFEAALDALKRLRATLNIQEAQQNGG